jgi:hypothetical protein
MINTDEEDGALLIEYEALLKEESLAVRDVAAELQTLYGKEFSKLREELEVI